MPKDISEEIGDLEKVIGKRLLVIRMENNVKRRMIAAFCDVSQQAIANYENGMSRISAGTLYYIAQNLKMPISHFFPQDGEVIKLNSIAKVELEVLGVLRKIPKSQQKNLLEIAKYMLGQNRSDNDPAQLEFSAAINYKR